jgi:hypothetical protein
VSAYWREPNTPISIVATCWWSTPAVGIGIYVQPIGEIKALILKLINTWGPPLENKERLTAAFIIFLGIY